MLKVKLDHRFKVKCPKCDGTEIIRHGRRTSRGKSVQIYRCKGCGRIFSDTTLPYLNTDSSVLLKGISLYNQGYSLKRCSEIMETTFEKRIPRNTIHHWIHRYEDIFTYTRIREKHEEIPIVVTSYPGHKCRFHRKKLKLLTSDYPGITSYFNRIRRGLKRTAFYGLDPAVFIEDEEALNCLDNSRISKEPECVYHALCEESDQLKELKRYLLINDAYTVGVDVPLYLTPSESGGDLLATIAPIIQIREHIRILDPSSDQNLTVKRLLGASKALIKRCDLDPDNIEIGGFDSEKMWLVKVGENLI